MRLRPGILLVAVTLTAGLVGAAQAQPNTGPLTVVSRPVGAEPDKQAASGADEGRYQAITRLMQELNRYQRQLRQLRGRVQELEHKLRMMKQAQRQRYLDLDMRLRALAEAIKRLQKSPGGATDSSDAKTAPEVSLQQDRQAYQAGKKQLLERDFKEAAKAFRAYLQNFPHGRFRANAHFWLGEVYRTLSEHDQQARKQFRILVEQYPGHDKTPMALYKLASMKASAGHLGQARVMLEKVTMQYPDSRAASLAHKMLKRLDSASQTSDGG